MFVQHKDSSNDVAGIWVGSKSDQPVCVVPMRVVFPGDGVSYSMLPQDRHVGADTSTAVATVTLPAPDSINDGHRVTIEDHGGNAGVNGVTIATPGAETTEVASIAANNGIAHLMWDATNGNWKDVG